MPYPNFHSARIKEPSEFKSDSFRNKTITDGIEIIIGKLKDGDDSMVTQAYRFDKTKFTADEAKKWLKDNKVDYISFEAAKEEKQTAAKGIVIGLDSDGSDLLICNGVDISGSNVPSEIDVLAEGKYYKKNNKGELYEIEVTAADVDAAVSQFKARRERHPNRDVVIDYEHQTLGEGQAPAAGWFSDLNAITRDGIRVARATVTRWTDHAAQMIKNFEYRYVSPVFALKGLDKETGKIEPCILKHAALTNEPLIDELNPIVAKHFSQTIKGKDTTMNDLIDRLRYFLNLATTATAEDILAELNKLVGQVKEAIGSTAEATTVTAKDLMAFFANIKTEIAAKADLVKEICAKDTGTIEEAKATYLTAKAAQTELVAAKEELTTLKTEKFTREFDNILAKAFTDGKILPVQKSDAAWMESQKQFAAKDMTAFNVYWEKQPKIAPTGKLPDSGDIGAKGITDEDKAMAEKLGVPIDQLEKHSKK
jgi:phage I-like protein